MASNIDLFVSLLCCLLASSLAMPKKSGQPEVDLKVLDLSRLPLNTVVMAGGTVTFTCSAQLTPTPRVQWIEYASTSTGNIISDNSFVLPGHPNAARYSLNTATPGQYDLSVSDVVFADAGRYLCVDTFSQAPSKFRHEAELIVLGGTQQCITTVPASGVAIEDTYYTYECTVNYKGNIPPNMRWSGPATFGQAQSDNGERLWSGLSFYAHRTMSTQYWTSLLNFTDSFVPGLGEDVAANVPDYEDSWDTPRIQISWPPKDMAADPVKPLNEYLVGDKIECLADAFPSATFSWHNLRTNERIDGSLFTIPQAWEGFNNPMRCDAYNTINGFRFNREHHITVIVPTPLTTPTTLPPTTTTPPPAVSQCFNLKGRWESKFPIPAYMCLEVNEANGNIHGVVRNATDTWWLDLIGSTNVPGFDHASFTGIWPQNRAVSTFIAECSRCHGEEHLIVSAISRSKGGPPCGQPGDIFYSQEYHFNRNPSVQCPPITIP